PAVRILGDLIEAHGNSWDVAASSSTKIVTEFVGLTVEASRSVSSLDTSSLTANGIGAHLACGPRAWHRGPDQPRRGRGCPPAPLVRPVGCCLPRAARRPRSGAGCPYTARSRSR